MKGWLAVNEFVRTPKFRDLFGLLEKAAEDKGIALTRMTNAGIFRILGETGYDLERLPAGERPDFVLFWDKDIRLARALEAQRLRLFNRAGAIEVCDDKSLTFLALTGKGIRMPKTWLSPKKFHADGLFSEELITAAEEDLGYPLVVKECLGSFGAQVYLVHDREELLDRVRMIGDRPYLLQEYIASSAGRDIRIQVVGEKIAAAMLRRNPSDFRANLTNGGYAQPYTPGDAEAQMALQAVKLLGLDFAGVDILFGDEGEPILCEVNSNAHFRNLYDCTGINTADFIMEHIYDEMVAGI